MSKSKNYTVPFRRKREGKTNYRKRLKLLSADKLRLVIRKSLNNITAQIIEYNYKGDKIILSAHSSELNKYEWKINKGNIPSAYLVGLLAGMKAIKKNIKCAILDIGLQKSVKGSRIYAALKGCIDAGINVPYSEDTLPNKDRIKGMHIKNKTNLDKLTKHFEETKKKILGA